MSTPLLVVDDSKMSRRLIKRSIPPGWDVEVSEAQNGVEALEAIRAGKAHVMFLDLTMPVMDGFQVLKEVREENLDTMVIVISADIQPKAEIRVKELGAMAFIKKPIDQEILTKVLKEYGIYDG
ncbi:MAG TPA: response regulator [Gammaproteobacteria bacterium]|nr:response regulator [Gammaproteobacteria bacterium]